MYSLGMASQAKNQLQNLAKLNHVDKILESLQDFLEDPYKRAKLTNRPVLGSYYVNTGNYYCALLEIDDNTHHRF